ncbi:MAG: hypothetical protein WBG41_12185 [Acidimicrobiales bacterium]
MSDAFEDRLRTHLAEKAAQVQANPDPGALMERSVGRSGHRRPLTIGALTIAVIFAGFGVLAGVNLIGGRATATPPAAAASTTVPGRAGASLAPGPSGASNVPSIAVQTPYTFLFTRTTSSGVTIRAYGSGSTTTGGCTQGPPCQPVGVAPEPTPCRKNAVCEQPLVLPQAQSGTTGSGSVSAGAAPSSGPAVVGPALVAPKTRSTPPTGSGGTGPVSVGTVPFQPAAECGQLVVELSTDKAVGTGSVSRPTMTAPSPATVDVLGMGSFGTAEGAPVGWVAVWVGSGVTSVHLSSGGTVVDAMSPNSGIAVLAVQGNSDLTGATVTGVDQSGAAVATTPADQASGPDAANACTTLPTTPPTTTTTTTTTDPTTMTTVPPTTTTTTTVPPTTTTTTTTTTPRATLPTPANTSVTSPNLR